MSTAVPLISGLSTVQLISVDKIVPSRSNPRKSIDQEALEQLAKSIAEVGIQVPLALRDTGDLKFEIIGGERRWRAAQLAGLTSVPAIIREYTDDEARDARLIENLQREDLSPLEEAQSYQELIAAGVGIDRLASKVGKTFAYVTQRLKLLTLTADARAAMSSGLLNLTLALLVCRLQPADQDKAVVYAIDPKRVLRAKDLEGKLNEGVLNIRDGHGWYRPANERELRDWIASHTLLELKVVGWNLDDEDLVAGAGSCTACPKRTGASVALFQDITAAENICTDPGCYERKRKAIVKERSRAGLLKLLPGESFAPLEVGATAVKHGQWLPAKKGSCNSVLEGYDEFGAVQWVCADQKCTVHKHKVVKPQAKSDPNGNSAFDRDERYKKELAYVERETPIRRAVYAAIKPKLAGKTLLRAVLHCLVLHAGVTDNFLKLVGIDSDNDWGKAKKAAEGYLARLKDGELESALADALVADDFFPVAWQSDSVKDDREDLWAIAKFVGVDADAIAAKLESKAATPEKPAKQAVAKKAAKPAARAAAKPVKKAAAKKKAVRK